MGLDIYAYRVKSTLNTTNPNEIYAKLQEIAQTKFEKTTTKLLKEITNLHETCSPVEYANAYNKFIMDLKRRVPLYKKYGFYLAKYGYEYRNNTITSIKSPQELEVIFNEEKKHIYPMSDAYFRKVNFIYEYFRNKLENESCVITKNELNEFIQNCKEVYNKKGNENYAKQVLPTTSGFFFGSTDYDEWYWNDVKDCIAQMQKIYKALKDDDYVMWDFSW
jgi:hypothetical protein